MGCDRVIVAGASATGGTTTVSWRRYDMAGLTGYQIAFSQSGKVTLFDAGPEDTSKTVTFTPGAGCMVTVTPDDSSGPVNDKSSAATPVPFPPPSVDPGSIRPVVLATCSVLDKVTVNWTASTVEYLAGYVITVFEGQTSLRNFQIPGDTVVSAIIDYPCKEGTPYQVIVTPYDDLSPVDPSYPVPIPYPREGGTQMGLPKIDMPSFGALVENPS